METAKTKTTALLQAKNALKDYLKKHNLNPMKDWRKDKTHGKEVTRLVTRLNLERDKVLDNYPYNDIHNETKLVKMKEKKQKAEKEAKKAKKAAKEATAKVAEAPKKEKTEKAPKEKKEKAATPAKYDYPLIDGREMTAAEKKKYRAEQRRLANGGEAKPKKEKKEKAAEAPTAPAPAKDAKKDKKKSKTKEAVPEKPLKEKKAKKDKKKSKAKDED